MEKKDIDLYLDKVNIASTKEEKIEATKELLSMIEKDIASINPISRMMTTVRKLPQDIIDYLVETSAMNVAHEIGMTEIRDLSRVAGFVIGASNSTNKLEESKRLEEAVEKGLKDKSILGENPTKEQIDIYDGILTRYLYNIIETGEPVSDFAREVTNNLFSNLPEGMSHRETLSYKLQLLRVMQEREDLGNLIPKLPADSYRELLNKPKLNRSGKPIVLGDFDENLNEFLFHYGKTGEIDIEEKLKLFETLASNVGPGKLINSKAYTKYFSVSRYEDDQKVAYGNNAAIIQDVLARIYENNGKDTRITDLESYIAESFYLPRLYDWEKEDPEEFAKMKEEHGDMPAVLELRGELANTLMNLFIHSASNPEIMARYMIRIKNMFAERNRPKEENLAKIYDAIVSMDMVELLKNNFDKNKLKDFEPDEIDMEEILKILGIEETEEEKQRRIDNDEYEKTIGYDPNSYNGLRRIDYADIALELMIESDYREGVNFFRNPETQQKYKDAGRDIYDSRAVRKMVELYVEEPSNYDKQYAVEDIIERYVTTVVSKPDFNIFKEQGIAELMQLGNLRGKCNFATKMATKVKELLNSNPTYSMSLDDSVRAAYDFMDRVGDDTINPEIEKEFDEFLVNLTRMRVSLPNYALPQDVVDFLMKQSMNPESIINLNRQKYGQVSERALEDLGKIDNLKRNGGKPLNYLYIVRDYLSNAATMGLHYRNIITVKRERLEQLANGNPDGINTIFHENTHMNQVVRLNNEISSYREYIMLKENYIRKHDKYDDYYATNYELFFEEIEAREVAAGMTADYLGKIAPKSQSLSIAEAAKNEVVAMLTDKFKQEQARFSEENSRESKLYLDGLQKQDSDGKVKSVNTIFANNFRYSLVMKELLKKVPLANFEYTENGDIRTFAEQMSMIAEKPYAFSAKDLIFIKNVLNHSQSDRKTDSKQSVEILSKLMTAYKGNELGESFVGAIVKNNFLPIVSTFVKSEYIAMRNNSTLTESQIDTYETVTRLIGQVKENPNAAWTKAFNEKNTDDKNIMDLLELYQNAAKTIYPNIDNAVIKLDKYRRQKEEERQARIDQLKHSKKPTGLLGMLIGKNGPGYRELAGVAAGVQGKNAVLHYEKQLEMQEEKKQIQEQK